MRFLPLETMIKIDSSVNYATIKYNKPDDSNRYRWNMLIFREKYNYYLNKQIESNIQMLQSLINDNDSSTIQTNLNKMYHELHIILKKSAEKAANEIAHLIKCKRIKIEPWWNNELIFLNKESKRLHSY